MNEVIDVHIIRIERGIGAVARVTKSSDSRRSSVELLLASAE